MLFELGIGTVVQQLASRERAFLGPHADGTLSGDPKAKARLAGLFRIAMGWFGGVMVIANIVIFPAGWFWIAGSPGTENVNWQLGWLLTVLVAAGQGVALALLLFVSGCGHVAGVARITAIKDAAQTVALALALLLGARLLSHPYSGAAGIAVMALWLV